jgi:two-component system invasion response regulator UvrY
VKILLVDDHAMVRAGLRRILSDDIEPAIFAEAASSSEALDRVRIEPWDIVVLDLSLPGRSGLETVKDIHALRSGLPILVMTMYAEDQYAVRAFRAGAAGYITKGSSPDDLVAAVRKVAAGGKYVSPSAGETLAKGLDSRSEAPPHASLSDRELQVLRMLGGGKTVSEIGADLSLSAKTVSTYRTRILQKLGMRTTAQLVHYCVAENLGD